MSTTVTGTEAILTAQSDTAFAETLVASGNLDIEQFTDEINRLLKMSWGEDWGNFQLDEPVGNEPENIPIPVITYDFTERIRSATHRSLDPILFDTIVDKDNSQIVKLYRSWFDICFVFSVYHISNKECIKILSELEAFLFAYKGHFKNLGVSEMIFQKEVKPTVKTRWSTQVVQRQVEYLVRIERITQVRSNVIKDITMTDTSTTNSPLHGQSKMMDHYMALQKTNSK